VIKIENVMFQEFPPPGHLTGRWVDGGSGHGPAIPTLAGSAKMSCTMQRSSRLWSPPWPSGKGAEQIPTGNNTARMLIISESLQFIDL